MCRYRVASYQGVQGHLAGDYMGGGNYGCVGWYFDSGVSMLVCCCSGIHGLTT